MANLCFHLSQKIIFFPLAKLIIPYPPGSLNCLPLGLIVLDLSILLKIEIGFYQEKNNQYQKVDPIFPSPADGELIKMDVGTSLFF